MIKAYLQKQAGAHTWEIRLLEGGPYNTAAVGFKTVKEARQFARQRGFELVALKVKGAR